jgi:sulfate permease, SulP family
VIRRRFPVLGWAPRYPASCLRPDVLAGLTIAVMLVPQSLAYASLAGMPPITGLYAAIISLFVYALLGTSSHLGVGPAALMSLLTAAALAPLGAAPSDYIGLAGLLAVMVALVQLAMALLRLGALVNLLSQPVISGFTSAAAIVIGFSQAGDLLGFSLPRTDRFIDLAAALWTGFGDTNPWALGIGLAGIAAMLAAKRAWPTVPAPLLVMIAAAAFTWGLRLAEHGLVTVGAMPAGLPRPALPALNVDAARQLWASAVTIALVGYASSISVGKAIAMRTRERLDPTQELVAQGGINLAAGVFSGFPVSGSFSRTAVAFSAGARTQLAAVVAAFGVSIAVFFLTPLLFHLPVTILAAIVFVAVIGLVDVRGAVGTFRTNRDDGVVLGATFVTTLVIGVETGLLTGIAVGLVATLYRAARPRIVEVGEVEGERIYRDVQRYPTIARPGVVTLRLDAPLTFMNAKSLEDRVLELIGDGGALRHIVLDASAMARVDATGVQTLRRLHEDLDEAGIGFHLATVRSPVRETLQRAGAWEEVAGGHAHPDLAEAVACCQSSQ